MGISNGQFEKLLREYDRRQIQNRRDQEERVRRAMERIPGLKETDAAVSDLSVERTRALLAGDAPAAKRCLQQLKVRKEEKAALLAAAGLEADYLEMRYQCPACKDTGFVEGQKCSCLKQAIVDLLFAQYPIREQLEQENFRTFSMDYFDREQRNPSTGMTSYENMAEIYDSCQEFVREFVPGKRNLLFMGPVGSGKTFMSNCIAEALIRQGVSVVYQTAGRLFEALGDAAFDRKGPAAKDLAEYILDCDLLILDDLGAEMNNSFVNSQLFTCLNERKMRKKSTLISTNLNLNQIRDAYAERVVSRLLEGYDIYTFYNSDIRIKKRLER